MERGGEGGGKAWKGGKGGETYSVRMRKWKIREREGERARCKRERGEGEVTGEKEWQQEI